MAEGDIAYLTLGNVLRDPPDNNLAMRVREAADGTFELMAGIPRADADIISRGTVAQAVFEGRAFLAPTGVQEVETGEALQLVLTNPSGSGKNLVITKRWFDNNVLAREPPLEYRAFGNPTAVLDTPVTPVNLLLGPGQPASVATFAYQLSAPVTMGGIEGSGGPMATGGARTTVGVLAVAPPGVSLGFMVEGQGAGVLGLTRVSATLLYYEVDV